MKKVTILTVIALFFGAVFSVQAQESRTGIGVRGGANFFTFGGSDASNADYDNRVGFHAGAYATLGLGQAFAIEPGVFYSIKGTQNDDLINSRAVLGYVDVPVLARLYLGNAFNVFAGPQVSYLVNSRFEGDLFGSSVGFDTDAIRDTDFGLVFGVGFNMPRGFNLQASYDYGTTPVFRNSEANVYNRGFKLSLGLTL
ncbi:MAG: porin family protein [Nitritalea sp.]